MTLTPLGSLPNKISVETWNGTGFSASQKLASGWSPDMVINNGQGFFVQTPAAAGTLSNTFVGSVVVNTGASTSNVLSGGLLTLVGGPFLIATDLNDTNNTLNTSLLPNKTTIEIWNGTGYSSSQKLASGWSPDFTIAVGQGFFVLPPAAGATLDSNFAPITKL